MLEHVNKTQPSMKVNVTSEDLIICECGGDVFTQVVRAAKIPAMLVGHKPSFTPVGGGLACAKCGTFVNEFTKSKKELDTPTIEG